MGNAINMINGNSVPQKTCTDEKVTVWTKIILPAIMGFLILSMFVILVIYCQRYNDFSHPNHSYLVFKITLEQLIQIVNFVFIVSAFVFFIPVSFYLFVYKKRSLLQQSVHKEIKRIYPDYSPENIDARFSRVFNESDYIVPMLFSTVTCFFGWLFVLFPYGPLLGDPEKFGQYCLTDLKGVISNIKNAASLISYSFLGAYFFSIQLLYRRFLRSDFKPNVFMFVTMRILISFIIVFVGSLLFDGGSDKDMANGIVQGFAFFAGICPTAVINYMQKKLNHIGFTTRAMEDEQSLNLIEGLTIWDEARLLEEGIENVQNLATANIRELIIHTRFNTNKLVDWIDQAYLILHVKSPRINEWRSSGIRTASDFFDAYERNKGALIKLTENQEYTVELYYSSMQKGPNAQLLDYWKKGKT